MSLIKFLSDVGKEVSNEVAFLNNGGCGVYAALIMRRLRLANIQAECLFENGRGSIPPDDLRKFFNQQKPNNLRAFPTGCTHARVLFQWEQKFWVHDSRETFLFGQNPYYINFHPGTLTVSQMERLARSPKGWNSMFDRARIPALRDIINTRFNEAFPAVVPRLRRLPALKYLQEQLDWFTVTA